MTRRNTKETAWGLNACAYVDFRLNRKLVA